ncbi:MAG: uncharacterized protein QOJ89_5078, partial [bacterium]
MPLRFRSQDQVVYELFEASGRNVRRATALLAQLLDDYPERAHLSGEIVVCEHDGDRLTHDIIHRLNAGSRVPLDPFDGLTLAKALDDIV